MDSEEKLDIEPNYSPPEKFSYGKADDSKYISDLSALIEYASRIGVRTQSSRINRYLEYLKQKRIDYNIDHGKYFKTSAGEPFISRYDWELYLAREIQELAWISQGLIDLPPSGFDEKLVEIFGGSDFAALDSNTKARNTQFELRIASYFGRAGCSVDLSTQTDVIVGIDDITAYMECKRIESINALQKRIDEAYKQIVIRMPDVPGKNFGLIAIDVTKAAFPHNGIVIGETPDHSRDILQRKLKAIAAKINTSTIFSSRRITEIWLQIHISNLTMSPSILTSRSSSYILYNEKLKRRGVYAARRINEARNEATKIDEASNVRVTESLQQENLIKKGTRFGFDKELFDNFIRSGYDDSVDPDKDVVWMKTPEGEESSISYEELKLIPEEYKIELLKTYDFNPEIAIMMFSNIHFSKARYSREIE